MTKTFKGIVRSVVMKNTAVVEVSRQFPHPLYRKLLKRSKKFKVETEGKELMIGDFVQIAETKPSSKGKNFKLLEVLLRVKEAKHA